jgi:hypothetical protein
MRSAGCECCNVPPVRARGRSPFLAGLAALAIATSAAQARAGACDPPSGVSPCIDANSLWLAPGAADFFSVAPARPLARGALALGFGLSFLDRPLRLHAPSPDPDGRYINVVRYAFDATVLLAYGLSSRFELTASRTSVLHQSGAGVEGYTSQSGPPLASTALRDQRLGAGYALVDDRALGFAAKARIELSLPFGDETELAGEPSLVGAPSVALSLRRGRVRLGSELGLRLRETTRFAGAALGTQATVALGAGFDVLDRELLSVLAETWLFPSLVAGDRDLPDGTRVRDVLLAPAEWQLSVRSVPLPGMALQLGAGTALPLSSERREAPDGSSDTEHYAGITAARFRITAVARFLFEPSSGAELKTPDRERRSGRRPEAEYPASGHP